MFEQRGHDQLIAIAPGHVQKVSTYFFDVTGLKGQYIGNVIRQDPSGHEFLRVC
jgi:hypothetical protein